MRAFDPRLKWPRAASALLPASPLVRAPDNSEFPMTLRERIFDNSEFPMTLRERIFDNSE